MPLWVVYHPPGTFVDDDAKQAFAQDATGYYTSIGLPAFYVVVEFIQLSPSHTWVGGQKPDPATPFVRLMIDHVAASMPDSDAVRLRATDRLEAVLRPHLADKGYGWEYHIDETDRRLWRVNGLVPPPHRSEAERLWCRENRAVRY